MPFTGEYDEMVVAAANRSMVRLSDGHYGRLIFWSANGDRMTVIREGRHIKYNKSDLLWVVRDEG